MPINQEDLEGKLGIFLQELDDEKLTKWRCNAFAFLNFRAHLMGQEDKNLQRMKTIMELKDHEIQAMAVSYQEYKNAHRLLLEQDEKDEKIREFNKKLTKVYVKLNQVREEEKQIKESKKNELKETSHVATIKLLEADIRKIRSDREIVIESTLKKRFGDTKWQQIQQAEQLYLYIHMIAAAFNPGINLSYQINNKRVNQSDYAEILQLFSSDEAKDTTHKKVFEIVWNFTKEELGKLFSDKKIIRDGDFIRLGSEDHAVFISFKNGKYQLFDLDSIIETDNPQKLAEKIEQHIFTELNININYMPIGISIFAKSKLGRPNRVKVLKDILFERASLNLSASSNNGITGTWMVACYGHQDTMAFLIEKKASLDQARHNGVTPAWIAAHNGHIAIISDLIEAKANLNEPDKEGYAPIWIAAQNNHANIIYSLSKAKVDVNQANFKGNTPAWIAAHNNHVDVIQALFEEKADLEKENKEGWTPIIAAAWRGNAAAIKKLYECQVNINKSNKEMQTALHIAVKKEKYLAVSLLIELDAIPNLRNNKSQTPLDCAEDESMRAFIVLHLLKKYIKIHPEIIKSPIANEIKKIDWNKAMSNNWTAILESILIRATSAEKQSFFCRKRCTKSRFFGYVYLARKS